MADSRSGLETGLAGMETADDIARMFGVHGAEEIGGGFVVGVLFAGCANA